MNGFMHLHMKKPGAQYKINFDRKGFGNPDRSSKLSLARIFNANHEHINKTVLHDST